MTEENNIFAVGCSFTWGESLQFFSGLDSVKWKKVRPQFPDAFKTLDEGQLNFIKENRWPAQLAKKLNVNHITQAKNGGTNNQSLLKAQYFYNNPENLKNYKTFIIQITDFSRDPIIFKLPNGETIAISDASIIREEQEIFGLYNDDIMFDSYEYFYNKLYEFILELEKSNIKVFIICYPKESVKPLLNHNLSKYYVPLIYNDMEYTSTADISIHHPQLVISNYFAPLGWNHGDNHLVLEGHKIICDSIYSRILADNNLK